MPRECLQLIGGEITSGDAVRCPGLMDFLMARGDVASWFSFALAGMPMAVGALLGSQVVAREVEHRTAVLAWSLETRRRRRLAERMGVAALVVTLVGGACAVASTSLIGAQNPGLDLGAGFVAYGLWGPLVLARGLAALAAGVAVGAAVWRVLPALLLSVLASLAITFGAFVAAPLGFPTETIVGGSQSDPGARLLDAVIDASGRVTSVASARAAAPPGLDPGAIVTWTYEHFRPVAVVIPGAAMPDLALREGSLLILLTGVFIGSSAAIVARRRPY